MYLLSFLVKILCYMCRPFANKQASSAFIGAGRCLKWLEHLVKRIDTASFIGIHRLEGISKVISVDVHRMQKKSIFNNQPERNSFRGRPRNSWWNSVHADLKKSKIFDWMKASTERDHWKRRVEEEKPLIGRYDQSRRLCVRVCVCVCVCEQFYNLAFYTDD